MDMEGKSNIRRMILVLAVLSVLSAAILCFLPVSTNAEPGKSGGITCGNITFTDSSGDLLSGIIAASAAGAAEGPQQNDSVGWNISWNNVADARIFFNALSSKSLAVKLWITGDSPEGTVIVENYGSARPVSVNTTSPGTPVKYVEISASGVSFAQAEITIKYTDEELNGLNESMLVIYHYNGDAGSDAQAWTELSTRIDAENNTLSAAVNSLSFFVAAALSPEFNIRVLDSKKSPINVTAEADSLKNIAVDALKTKNVAVELKNANVTGEAQVILEDYGSKNPVQFPLPGRAVKYVEIGADNISFSSASITIRCSDAELNGASERDLNIYHWNAASWDAVPTIIDAANRTLSTTATSLSLWGVAASNIYYLENNATPQSVGADGNTSYNASGNNITAIPYKNLLKHGTNGTGADINYTTTSPTTEYEVFRFYLPFNYSEDTRISANTSFNISWIATDASNNRINVSLIDYDPASGAKTVIGSRSFNATASQETTYGYQIDHPEYTIPQGSSFMFQINTTTGTTGTVGLHFNDYNSNITVNEYASAGSISGYVASADVALASIGWPDCISCHDVYGSGAPDDKRINASIIKQGVHGNLNSNSDNSSAVDALNKACWACHGDGIEPVNHPSSSTYPWSCTDCHNRTAEFDSSNITLKNDITKKKVAEHIQYNYYEHISSTRNNSAVNCTFCHNMSLLAFNDTASITLNSSVSHYAGNISLVSTDCNICHKNTANAGKYYADLTRHPARTQDVWYCRYCHNTTNASSLHSQGLYFIYGPAASVHLDFDWEEDDWNESMGNVGKGGTLDTPSEGCVSCHKVTTYEILSKKCENCHLPDETGLFTGPFIDTNLSLNASINESIPRAYRHTNYSDVNVPDQSPPVEFHIDSTCYGFGANMSCHGVNYQNRSSAGGYFAYNNLNEGEVAWYQMYHFTNTIDKLPDTANCLFCHNQSSDTIRKAWGSAIQLNRSNMFDADTDENCYSCHTTDNSAPEDFHAITVVKGGGPGCLGCHNISSRQKYTKEYGYVDAINYSSSIHALMNWENNSGYGINASCWACHNSSGTPVASNIHPDKRYTPYICTDCHLAGGRNAGAFNAAIVSEHFINGTGIKTSNASSNITSCIACHNKSEMLVANNDTDRGSFDADGDGTYGGNVNIYHYGRSRSQDLRTGNDTNCSYCHQNASTAFATAMMDPEYSSSITNHSLRYNNSNPGCTVPQCHKTGWIHNSTLTKPTLALPNSTFCLSCHGNNGSGSTNFSGVVTGVRSMHNNSVNCTQCHLNKSRNIHPVRYLQQDGSSWDTSRTNAVNCTTCHQSTLSGFSSAPLIPGTLKHSNNLSNGSLWNSTSTPFWKSEDGACYYCHNNTKHNATALGSINSLLSQNNTRNGILPITTWCADCHYNMSNPGYKGSQWSQTPPLITIDNTGKSNWVNHSDFLRGGYKDSICKPCHPLLNGSYLETSLNYSHSLSAGLAGPDCISCHDIGRTGANHRINNSVMNLSDAIHARLNENAANSSWVSGENRKCWGCHDSTGSQPGNDSMGSRYNNPYKCYDCHNATAKPYSGVSGALNVSEHFMNGEIKAANASDNSSSCIICHIKSEMNLSYTEDDPFNSSYSLISHYGRKRPDLRDRDSGQSVNCSYCHQNASTAFATAMMDPEYSGSITNHSLRYNTSNPGCTSPQCHNTGWIHNSTLTKPALALPNSTFCLSCHGNNGTGGTNYSGVVTGVREKHNNTVNCTECHLNTGKDIHPVKYLQPDAIYNTSNSTAVNCTTCHQTTAVDSRMTVTPPKIPSPLNHSTNKYSGALWNGSQPRFWDNTSQRSSCEYCHGRIALHNLSALGNIRKVKGSNTLKQDLSTSTWCANCHYAGAAGYAGTFFSPEPPEILNLSGKVPARARDNTDFYNHSHDVLKGYNDSVCKYCHNNALEEGATSLNFSHNVAPGGGGPDCISCHYIGASAQNINVTAINDINSIHKDLNKEASATDNGYNDSKKCWACHGNGQEPSGHPAIYKTPYSCTDCHVQGAGQNFNFTPNNTLLNITQHYWNGSLINTKATSCYACHNTSEMIIAAYDPDGASSNVYSGINGGNDSVSHYGKKRKDLRIGISVNCSYCHQNTSTIFITAMMNTSNSNISNHSLRYNTSNPGCTSPQCHNTGWIHNSTLTRPALALPNSTFCLSCHGNNGTEGTNYSGVVTGVREKHNNTVNCTECHLNTGKDIHPVKYLQPNAIYNTGNSTAVNCTTCHQTAAVDSRMTVTPPKIPSPLNHSTNPYSGALWNGSQPRFWDNTSQRSSCEYCHGRIVLHNISALGNISKVKGSNTLRQDLSTSTWCVNCHYKNASGYNGTSFFPEPPEILNLSGKVPARARDNTSFYNHSRDVAKYNDSDCQKCHNNGLREGATSLNFSHNVAPGGGGPDCISCHDINVNKLREEKRIIAASMRLGVHGNLNSNAANSTPIDPLNKACWACHLEGNEPVGEHYNTPARQCDDNDCHSLEQSYRAPMVYSHFKDAELNSNPERALNYNISTSTSCYACHNNSLSASYGTFNASVSHYASTEELPDTENCIYCHLDEDNAEKWGNATEINKNRSAMIEMDREKNKFTAYAGEFMDLGIGYRIKVVDISEKRGSALIELYKENSLVDSGLVNIGNYTYEETRIIKNASSRIPVIILNITEMFVSDNESFIQFKGYRIKRVHSENRTTSCYLCHFQGGAEKHKYTVIDRVDDNVYYTEVFFNSSDSNEYDQQQALQILANKTPSDAYTDIERAKRKTLKTGEKWKLDENYSVTLEDISTNSDSAMFLFEAGNRSFTDIVKKGEMLEHELSINYLGYTSTNTTVFSAKVSEILQPSLVVLEDIYAISPEITKVKDNTSVYGYNASWIWENDTFMTGPIPSSLHTPLLYDGKDGGAACLSCHNIGELGFHEDVNSAAASSVASANKACWACHGEGKEPEWHPANYQNPRNCKSCHVEKTGITYNATFIGDEKHGALVNCIRCHVEDTHRIIRFDVGPDIRKLSISKEKVQAGEKINISATASAGYEMRLRGAEYYVDSPDKTIPMSALDGSFDDRVEDLTAELNTSGLETGNHSIYVRAMERNNKWGPVSSISISVEEKGAAGSGRTSARTLLLITGFSVISVLLIRFVLQHLASGKKPQ